MSKIVKSIMLSALCLAVTASFAADQSRTVPGFKSITSKGAYHLTIEVGQTQSIKISGDETQLNKIKTEVVGDDLVLNYKGEHHVHDHDDLVRIVVTVPVLNSLHMEGAGMTKVKHISGERFELVTEGAGILSADGNVDKLRLVAKGVGVVDAKRLKSKHAEVVLEGVGAVKTYASESLNASVDGIGSLTYYGNPAKVSKSVSGLGHVGSAN